MKTNTNEDKPIESFTDISSQTFYHGNKADLKQGDLISPGYNSNFGKQKKASYVYLTATRMLLPGAPNLPWVKGLAEFIL